MESTSEAWEPPSSGGEPIEGKIRADTDGITLTYKYASLSWKQEAPNPTLSLC